MNSHKIQHLLNKLANNLLKKLVLHMLVRYTVTCEISGSHGGKYEV
jgi:hypothetical protein